LNQKRGHELACQVFGRAPATPDAAHALLADIEKQGKQYLDEADNGNWVYPACQRKSPDTGAPTSRRSAIKTRLEAFRYLLMVPRGEFKLLAEPDSQAAILDAIFGTGRTKRR
jgi:hypothetical protein